MSTSLVEYHGSGFWAPDSCLRIWLGAVIWECGPSSKSDEWLLNLAKKWRHVCTIPSAGMVSTYLDEAETKDGVASLVNVSRRALARLESLQLTGHVTVKPSDFGLEPLERAYDCACEIDCVWRVGKAFCDLLEERLKNEAPSYPIVT